MQMLRLAPPQEEQLLLVRKKHLRNLRELYNDRQRMNLQVRPPGLWSAAPRCCASPEPELACLQALIKESCSLRLSTLLPIVKSLLVRWPALICHTMRQQ